MTGIYTLIACMKIIAGSSISKNFRGTVDQIMLIWSQRLLALLNLEVKVNGRENFPAGKQKPIIVMCNHSSLYDIPISAVALNTSLRMLAKKELFKIPVFSSAIRRGEFVSIDRQNHEQSIKDLEKAKLKMLDGIRLWVAPEGTRSKDGQLASFKRGGFHLALETQALVVPIVIKNVHRVQAGNDLTLYLNQQVEVEICEPIDANLYSKETRTEFVNDVRNKMLAVLNQSSESKK